MRVRVVFGAAFFALACLQLTGSEPADPLATQPEAVFNGWVEYVGVEGGCWALSPSAGVRYLPTQLPADFRRDGLAVRAEVRRTNLASTCMVGPVVELISIRPR